MNEKKRKQVEAMDTSAIESILEFHASGPGAKSPEDPLAGVVHIEGIGQVSIAYLETEIKRRGAAA